MDPTKFYFLYKRYVAILFLLRIFSILLNNRGAVALLFNGPRAIGFNSFSSRNEFNYQLDSYRIFTEKTPALIANQIKDRTRPC
jgi:hypothetical protein